jgi:hypothetical protein
MFGLISSSSVPCAVYKIAQGGANSAHFGSEAHILPEESGTKQQDKDSHND